MITRARLLARHGDLVVYSELILYLGVLHTEAVRQKLL